jgi:hypothetical protein
MKETITMAITTTLFFDIWGEKGGLAHVASKGLPNFRYLATIQKIIYYKTFKAS